MPIPQTWEEIRATWRLSTYEIRGAVFLQGRKVRRYPAPVVDPYPPIDATHAKLVVVHWVDIDAVQAHLFRIFHHCDYSVKRRTEEIPFSLQTTTEETTFSDIEWASFFFLKHF